MMTPNDLQVTHHFVQFAQLRMHYVERGFGPTVLLLHGFPECWWSWRRQFSPLAGTGAGGAPRPRRGGAAPTRTPGPTAATPFRRPATEPPPGTMD